MQDDEIENDHVQHPSNLTVVDYDEVKSGVKHD